MDATAFEGTVYYRLKIVGLSGEVKYSNTILVKKAANTAVNIYPNPAVNSLHVSGLNGNSTIKIMNANGQLVMQQKTSASTISLEITSLKAGMYVIDITSNGEKVMSKNFIKQ